MRCIETLQLMAVKLDSDDDVAAPAGCKNVVTHPPEATDLEYKIIALSMILQ